MPLNPRGRSPSRVSASLRSYLFYFGDLKRARSFVEVYNFSRFLLTGLGITKLLATNPRSGYNYLALTLAIAVDLQSGGSGDFEYHTGAWVPAHAITYPCDSRIYIRSKRMTDRPDITALGSRGLARGPYIYHTHNTYGEIPTLAKRNMKKVVLVRNIHQQLASWLFHAGYGPDRQMDFMRDGYLKRSVGFVNSWGRRLLSDNTILAIGYCDLCASPATTMRSIADHFQLVIGDDALAEAAARTSKEQLLKKIPGDERRSNPRVSVGRRFRFNSETEKYMRRYIDDNLQYDLGYDLRS